MEFLESCAACEGHVPPCLASTQETGLAAPFVFAVGIWMVATLLPSPPHKKPPLLFSHK